MKRTGFQAEDRLALQQLGERQAAIRPHADEATAQKTTVEEGRSISRRAAASLAICTFCCPGQIGDRP